MHKPLTYFGSALAVAVVLAGCAGTASKSTPPRAPASGANGEDLETFAGGTLHGQNVKGGPTPSTPTLLGLPQPPGSTGIRQANGPAFGSGARSSITPTGAAGMAPGAASSATAGVAGRIAFGASDGLHIVNPDGSRPIRTADSRPASSPRWSPDGTAIAFLRDTSTPNTPTSGFFELDAVQADGSREVQLSHPLPGDFVLDGPSWSPDGRRLAFSIVHVATAYTTGGSDIYVVNRDGSHQSAVTLANSDNEPQWSPDGAHILFRRYMPATSDTGLFTVRPDGSGLTELTSSSGYADAASWSPNGRRIAFAYSPTGIGGASPVHLWMVNADGSGGRDLGVGVRSQTVGDGPVWSPDGSWLVFPANSGIAAIRPDGTGLRNVTGSGPSVSPDDYPSWSPDGRHIAFIESGTGIWVVDADGSSRHQAVGLTTQFTHSAPVWMPD